MIAQSDHIDAIKFDLDMEQDNEPDPYNGRLTNAALNRKVEVVDAVREAVSNEIDLAFDCHWDYTVESATRLASKLEPYDLMWLEDVVPPEETDAQREVARRTETPLATGENRFRIHELSELLDEYAVDVITPDPTTCGGLAESKRIAERAEERYIPVSPHNVCSPVGRWPVFTSVRPSPTPTYWNTTRSRSTGGMTCSSATSR